MLIPSAPHGAGFLEEAATRKLWQIVPNQFSKCEEMDAGWRLGGEKGRGEKENLITFD